MRLVRRALVTGAVAVLLSQPAQAVADTLTHRDPVGDVARSPIGSSTYTLAPARIEGDITSMRVQHGRRAIWISIRLRDLTTTTNGNFHRLAIKSDRRYRAIALDAFPGHWAGTAVVTNIHGLAVGCRVRHRIDYVANAVGFRVPRRCLGHQPRWVRVGARTAVAGANYAYADDAIARGYSASLVLGKRVHR
jgi:hypothetical protein